MAVYVQVRSFLSRYYRVILAIAILIYVLIEAKRNGDFYIFLLASRMLQEGGDIYTNTFISGFHYFYSPLFAVILVPFTWLPDYVTKLLWLLANLFFVYRIYKLIPQYLNLGLFTEVQKRIFWFIGMALAFRFLYFNFHLIQMTIFLLYALLEGTTLVTNKKEMKGAALLSLAMNIKIMPVIILPWLLYRGYLRAFLLCLFFLILFLVLPAVAIGWDYNLFLHQSWWNLINPTQEKHVIDINESGFHSLTTFFAVYLIDGARNNYDLLLKRNIASLDVETVTLIINVSRVLLVAGTLWFLRSLPFKKASSPLQQFWEFSYILAVTPLIFPHQQFYAFIFLLPAFFYLVYRLIQGNMNRQLLTGLIVIFILCSFIGGVLGFLRDISRHYKLITFGALITIALLAWYKPEKEIKPDAGS